MNVMADPSSRPRSTSLTRSQSVRLGNKAVGAEVRGCFKCSAKIHMQGDQKISPDPFIGRCLNSFLCSFNRDEKGCVCSKDTVRVNGSIRT